MLGELNERLADRGRERRGNTSQPGTNSAETPPRANLRLLRQIMVSVQIRRISTKRQLLEPGSDSFSGMLSIFGIWTGKLRLEAQVSGIQWSNHRVKVLTITHINEWRLPTRVCCPSDVALRPLDGESGYPIRRRSCHRSGVGISGLHRHRPGALGADSHLLTKCPSDHRYLQP